MTELILKNDIDDDKLKTLIDILKTWGVNAEVRNRHNKRNASVSQAEDFPFSIEFWQKNNRQRVKRAKSFFSNLSVDMSDFHFDRNEANER